MTKAPQRRKGSFGFAAGAALAVGSVWFACQPGELPCDRPEWVAVCNERMGGGGVGGTAGMGGSGGGGNQNAATLVANCTKWPTLGDMDKFFANRCGAAASCHVTAYANVWSDMQTAEVWKRLKDKSPATSCKGAKLINSTSWQESVIWSKVQTGTPTCPPGATTGPGIAMPPQVGFEPKLDPVTDEERTCLEGYLKAISGQQ
jgi:hypothetical protein